MRLFLLTVFIISTTYTFAQNDVVIDYKKSGNDYVVYVNNNEYSAVSIKLDIELINMQSTKGNHKIFVVPPKVELFEITRLKILESNKNSNFMINTLTALGDHFQKEYDLEYPYDLPYESKETYMIMQGYNGHLSHLHQYAIDFGIPEGGKVLSARDGVVVDVIDYNGKSCPQPKCNKYNNFIRVYHTDGTFAEYTHIQRGSARVKKGEKIKQGQHIANCGKVGWTTGPHLHFEVFLLNMDKKVTVPTKFKVSDQLPLATLQSKRSYRKSY